MERAPKGCQYALVSFLGKDPWIRAFTGLCQASLTASRVGTGSVQCGGWEQAMMQPVGRGPLEGHGLASSSHLSAAGQC